MISYKNCKGFSKIDNIKTVYEWKKELGRGCFGVVFEAYHIKARTPVAIKVVNKSKVSAAPIYEKLMRQELEVLEDLDHPNIVRVIELLESADAYYIVMELMPDGNLLDMMNKISKQRISFTERDAANLVNQVVLAISYMHASSKVHRDLKLENLMV